MSDSFGLSCRHLEIHKNFWLLHFGRGAKPLGLAMTGRVTHMLLQGTIMLDGLSARALYPASAFECISSSVEEQAAPVLL